jgi:hypothetical protein
MLTGLTVEGMYIYYAVVSVHATATSKSIRLFIDILLKAADRYFELYQAHSLPFFHKGIEKFIRTAEPFAYLVVAEDRQFFTIMTNEMFAKCTTNFYAICPSNLALRKSINENCFIALFTGKTVVALRKCKREILNDFEPIWIRSPDPKYWVYSLKEPTRVTLKCRPLGGSPLEEDETVEKVLLTNTGILPNSSTCYVYAETFKLLPHSLGRTLIGLNKAQVVLPNIEAILKPDEQDMLLAQFNAPASLRKVDDLIMEATRNSDRPGLDVTTVLSNLRAVESTPSPMTTYWIIGLSIFSLTTMSFCCYCHRSLIVNIRRELCEG